MAEAKKMPSWVKMLFKQLVDILFNYIDLEKIKKWLKDWIDSL